MAVGAVTSAALLIAGLLALQSPGLQAFELRPGPAEQAINRLAAQAGVDIVIATDLRGRRTVGLTGRLTTETALEQLLRPLGARAVRIGPDMYRIETRPQTPSSPPRPPAPPVTVAQLGEIVVTAVPPVGVSVASGRDLITAGALQRMEGTAASDAIADLSATVDSTRQGAGRNKLFVRGLADSAMNGPLQATVGQYLGDLRLSFGSPDPDLSLIDIRRVEVFEGPQGTRFGVGSIGGVLRLQPEPPALDDSARFILGVGATSGGGESSDTALILNRRLSDRTAGRLVAYGRREGGFLDNPSRDLQESDRVDTVGGRAALRWEGDAWTVDILGAAQRVSARDSQTVRADALGFARTGGVLEPYESSLLLAGVTARRQLGALTLTSATGVSRQTLNERFDASQPSSGSTSIVDRRQTATTASSELRIGMGAASGWNISGGGAIAVGETLVERRPLDLSSTSAVTTGADLRRHFAEATAFGEASLAPAPDWRVAIGARLSAVRIDSDIRYLEIGRMTRRDRGGATVRITPSLSARWDASPQTTYFVRLEQAVRPAGVNEAGGAFERYQGDRVTLAEVGAQSRATRADLSGEVSIGWVDWRDVQADVVTQGGDLVTDNVGNGVIRFLSAKAVWRPTEALDVSGGVFINDSRLTRTRPSIIGVGRTDIPNVAPLGAQVSLSYEAGMLADLPLRLGADLRYVGQSRLGVGPALDVPQGGYLRSDLTARIGDERRAATLRISNPLDSTGIRYGIGSPYQLSQPQIVPIRPLAVRLTFESSF